MLNGEEFLGDDIEYSLYLESDSEDFPSELEKPTVEDPVPAIFAILEDEL